MNLIFGSCAVKHWFPEFRIPNDLDILSKQDYWISAFDYLSKNQHNQYVDPNFLYTIKISHAPWDIHWDKTIKDILFLRDKGCELDLEFYTLLYKDWCFYHKDKKIKLNVSNDKFFSDNVTRKFNHDQLHEFLCFYDRPLHERIRKHKNSPLCDEKLFVNLSFEDRIKTALEEIHVIATERYLFNKSIPLKHAKYKALKHLITSMTKGWFNRFLIINFDHLMNYEIDTWKFKLENIV